jgi:hypothetical protein
VKDDKKTKMQRNGRMIRDEGGEEKKAELRRGYVKSEINSRNCSVNSLFSRKHRSTIPYQCTTQTYIQTEGLSLY